MKIPKQIQTEGRGEPTEHLNTSETSFIQRESFPHHQDHNIQSFLGLPQTIQKRSLKFINTHFGEMCICILGLRKGWGERGKIMKFCHPLNIDGQREHSQCTGVREKKAWVDVRAAGMQSMLIRLIFLRRCALANDRLLTCYTGVKCWVRKSLSVPSVELWVKAQKWRAAKLRKRRGEGAENAELEGKKRLLIQKN